MRFTTRQKLVRRLLHDLGIKTVPFKGEGFDKSYFLRGKHFRDDDLKKCASPCKLPDTPERRERGRVPDDLVKMVLSRAKGIVALIPK